MGNCLFAYPDRTRGALLSGGAWSATLPLANLQNPLLGAVARTTDLAPTSTTWAEDLGQSSDVRVLAVLNHNASLSATIRVRCYGDSGRSQLVYDTGTVAMIPRWYPQGSLYWGHPSFWTGAPSADDLADVAAGSIKQTWLHVLPQPVTVRAVLVEVVDTANPAGYFETGRCLVMPAWQPDLNISYGLGTGYETDTTSERSLGGVDYWDVRAPRRVQTMRLDHVDRGVADAWLLEMQRRLGIHGELFFVLDPDVQTVVEQRRSFLCTMRKLNPLEWPYMDNNQIAIELQEVL